MGGASPPPGGSFFRLRRPDQSGRRFQPGLPAKVSDPGLGAGGTGPRPKARATKCRLQMAPCHMSPRNPLQRFSMGGDR